MEKTNISVIRVTAIGIVVLCGCALSANATEVISNPEWSITISEFGYSDELLDLRPGFTNADGDAREYLSGEWGAAVGYSVAGQTTSPTWLEPNFIFPDWQTNSNFSVTGPFTSGSTNSDGFDIWTSTVANSDLQIAQTFQMLDTQSGTPQGTSPAGVGGAGSVLDSSRYVLQQTYSVRNISGQPISGLNLFQFLHGFQSENAVFDDRRYPGTFEEYQYDITQQGVSRTLHDFDAGTHGIILLTEDPGSFAELFDDVFGIEFPDVIDFAIPLLDADAATVRAAVLAVDPAIQALIDNGDPSAVAVVDFLVQTVVDGDGVLAHDDTLAFHSRQAPDGFEVGAYGIEGIDSHLDDGGKPGTGVHLSVEGDSLSDLDRFFPDTPWVSGAQKFSLPDLEVDEEASFNVLLSIRTTTTTVPEPVVSWLSISSMLAFVLSVKRRRC